MKTCQRFDAIFNEDVITMYYVSEYDYDRILKIDTHTHTHNRFMALLDFVRDYSGEPEPER